MYIYIVLDILTHWSTKVHIFEIDQATTQFLPRVDSSLSTCKYDI